VFSTYLYDGTGTSFSGPGQTITNGIDLAGEGGMVWLKARNSAEQNLIIDTVRGGENRLIPNNVSAAGTDTGYHISSFNSDGFSLQANGTGSNGSGYEYASWTFRKQPGFFDVVTYTGTGSNQSIAHNLGSVPGMIIIKQTSGTEGWFVWHRSFGYTKFMYLNSSAESSNNTTDLFTADPDSSNFYVGGSQAYATNQNGQTYVAYLFAHDAQDFGKNSNESIIKCGTYTGNGSATGVEVNLGFEPQWLLVKTESGSGTHKNWWLLDNMRGLPTASSDTLLAANLSDAETGGTDICDLTASGFIPKNGAQANQNSMNYIYVAIRRPHKPAEEFAATDLYATDTWGGGPPAFTSNFPVDLGIRKYMSFSNESWYWSDRLRDKKILFSDTTAAEGSLSSHVFDFQDGWNSNINSLSDIRSWMFRRAPGFFDVVAYPGTGGVGTVSHNLGVAPELIVVKNRGGSVNWLVYYQAGGINESLVLNQTGKSDTYANSWGYQAPSETQFYVNVDIGANTSNNNYIAYLFATAPGISKVGTYTGTGAVSNNDVDCGFTSGARFVLVKRTDSTGDWYVWDSARGIVAGNDPYLLLNSDAAQVTSTDYIDPLSSGFTITSTAPAALNASGGNYIFLAIA